MAVSLLLAILGWSLLTLVLLLLLLLLLLLFLPLDIDLRVDSDLQAPTWEEELTGKLRWLLRLRWGRAVLSGRWEGEFFTIVRSEVRILGIGVSPGAGRGHRKAAPGKKKKRRSGIDLELIGAMVAEVARFLRWLIERFGFGFQGELTYGFADPALTGWCEAIRWTVGLPVPIRLEPEFQRPALLGRAQTQGRIYGYQVAGAALRALRNPVIRNRLARRIRFRPLRSILQGG